MTVDHRLRWSRMQALKLAERPVGAALYRLLGSVLGSRQLWAKAVHAEPGQRSSWSQLLTCRS